MNDEVFSEEDAQFDRQDRFKARREMVNLMIELGVEPNPVRIETPRGVHKTDKLRAFVEQAPRRFPTEEAGGTSDDA